MKLFKPFTLFYADPGGRAVKGVGLRQLDCWDRGFESCCGRECLPRMFVVFCEGDGPITRPGESCSV